MRTRWILGLILLLLLSMSGCAGVFEVGLVGAHESEADVGVLATVNALSWEHEQLSATLATLTAAGMEDHGSDLRQLSLLYHYDGNLYLADALGERPEEVTFLLDALSAEALWNARLRGTLLAYAERREIKLTDLAAGATNTLYLQPRQRVLYTTLLWSSDGQSLAYAMVCEDEAGDFGRVVEVGVLNPQTQDQKVLTQSTNWSGVDLVGYDRAAGELWLIPRGQDPSFAEIHVYHAERTGAPRRVLDISGDGEIRATADGRRLAAMDYDAGRERAVTQVYDLRNPTAPAEELIHPEGSFAGNLLWAGDWLVYTALGGKAYWEQTMEAGGIWAWQPDSGARLQIMEGDNPDDRALFASPEGLWVLVGVAHENVSDYRAINVLSAEDMLVNVPPGAAILGWIPRISPLVEALPVTTPAPPAQEPQKMQVTLFFGNTRLNPETADCGRVFPVTREVQASLSPAVTALEQLFAGPTDEEKEAGYLSTFSSETRSILKSLTFSGNTAYVNFSDIRSVIPSASSSCGSQAFFAEVETTLKSATLVDRVIYAINGDPERFYLWMQRGCDESNDFCDAAAFAGRALTGSRPNEVVESFYSWYLDYVQNRGNPLADKAYRTVEYLSTDYVAAVDKALSGMEGGGADPFVCAQDIPPSLVVQEAGLFADRAEVIVQTAWPGSDPRDLLVELKQEAGRWRITTIRCPGSFPSTEESQPEADVEGMHVYHLDGWVYLRWDDGEGSLFRLPEDAGHLTQGSKYLAFVSAGNIYVLDLREGTTRVLLEPGNLPAQDYHLRWSTDGSTLAYAMAWEAREGSRMVEVGLTDGYAQTVLDTIVARQAGPTPTPPAMPSMEPEPGFANLILLGFDRVAGTLVAMPAGGQEGLRSVWTYDLRGKGKPLVQTFAEEETPLYRPSLSPDGKLLAVFRSEGLLVHDAGALDHRPIIVDLPPGTHSSWLSWSPDSRRLTFLVNEGEAPGLDVSPSLGVWEWDSETGLTREMLSHVSPEASITGWAADGSRLWVEMLDGISRQVKIMLINPLSLETEQASLPPGSRFLGRVGE